MADAVKKKTGASPVVKWPNDVLLNGKKICGILSETDFCAGQAGAVVVGIGVNLLPGAFDGSKEMNYPAGDIFSETGCALGAESFLRAVLEAAQKLRLLLPGEAFIREWNGRLAFKGEVRQIRNHKGETIPFRLLGVLPDGSLWVEDAAGQRLSFQSAEILTD